MRIIIIIKSIVGIDFDFKDIIKFCEFCLIVENKLRFG